MWCKYKGEMAFSTIYGEEDSLIFSQGSNNYHVLNMHCMFDYMNPIFHDLFEMSILSPYEWPE